MDRGEALEDSGIAWNPFGLCRLAVSVWRIGKPASAGFICRNPSGLWSDAYDAEASDEDDFVDSCDSRGVCQWNLWILLQWADGCGVLFCRDRRSTKAEGTGESIGGTADGIIK